MQYRNIMIGTDPQGRGGIASVVAGLRDTGFLERHSIRYIVSHCATNGPKKATFGLVAFFQLIIAAMQGQARIVHVHSASRASFFRKSVYLATARLFGAKTILHLHGGGFKEFVDEQKYPFVRGWIKWTLDRTSRIVALSGGWGSYFRTLAPTTRIDVIGNSVLIPTHVPPKDGDIEALVFLGAIVPGKGVSELLDAFVRLRRLFPDLGLVIGGQGQIESLKSDATKYGVENAVDFPGWIDAVEKAHLLSRRVVFVLPSYAEGLPMAMLEAMAYQCPVVVTTVGGIPEVIEHEINGILVPPRDADALFSALLKVIAAPSDAFRMGAAGRMTVERNHSAAAASTKLDALYDSLQDNVTR